jgi:hypothetical protein
MTVDFEAIHPGMPVLDANAELVGTVTQAPSPDGRFRVRQEREGELEIPFTAVQEVDQDRVVLSCTREDCTRYRVSG